MIYELSGVRPTLGRDVFVASNATIIGDVVVGDESSVWFSAVIRGDIFPIRIGARTNIQDGSVVHVTNGKAMTTIGDDVTVGHMVMLHGCTVRNRSLIGMSSTLLDHSEVGEECLVAAGSLLPPNFKVPPRSVVMGRPAKIVRSCTPRDLEMIEEAARLYVGYARTFMTNLRPIDG